MESLICCPQCKSQDLTFIEKEEGMVLCNNCENKFESYDSIAKKYDKVQKRFNILTMISCITLVLGTVFFIGCAYLYYQEDGSAMVAFLNKVGLTNDFFVALGSFMYVICVSSITFMFKIRKDISTLARARYYAKKRGIIEAEDK